MVSTHTQINNIIILLGPLQILLNLSFQPIQIINHNFAKIPTASLLKTISCAGNSILQSRNLLAVFSLLKTIARCSVLRSRSKMMVLGAHMVDPRTADSITLHSSVSSKLVQIGHSSGELGNRCIFIAVHNGLLPEALLALCEE